MLAYKPHKGAIFQVAFAPDGASVATCGPVPAVCVADAATGKVRWRHDIEPSAGPGLGLAYSPDGTRLAVVSWTAAIVFDVASGALRHTHPGRGCGIAFTPGGSAVVTGAPSPYRGARRTALETGTTEPIDHLGEITTFNRFRYSPDGRLLAALAPHYGQAVNVLDARTGALVARAVGSHHTAGVGTLAFHPRASVLVYSGGPRLVAYDFRTRDPIAERVRSKKYVQDAAFTPDGRHLLTVSNDATAVLWETAEWTEVREFAWDIGPLKSVAVAPDGGRAVCASDRGRVVVWDLDL
ncbi:MAG: hypothetical protein J0I06_26405 [Planctomycetes bacterium]|nr:hypothetical protein [Planctomycetota bacterium]